MNVATEAIYIVVLKVDTESWLVIAAQIPSQSMMVNMNDTVVNMKVKKDWAYITTILVFFLVPFFVIESQMSTYSLKVQQTFAWDQV